MSATCFLHLTKFCSKNTNSNKNIDNCPFFPHLITLYHYTRLYSVSQTRWSLSLLRALHQLFPLPGRHFPQFFSYLAPFHPLYMNLILMCELKEPHILKLPSSHTTFFPSFPKFIIIWNCPGPSLIELIFTCACFMTAKLLSFLSTDASPVPRTFLHS